MIQHFLYIPVYSQIYLTLGKFIKKVFIIKDQVTAAHFKSESMKTPQNQFIMIFDSNVKQIVNQWIRKYISWEESAYKDLLLL